MSENHLKLGYIGLGKMGAPMAQAAGRLAGRFDVFTISGPRR